MKVFGRSVQNILAWHILNDLEGLLVIFGVFDENEAQLLWVFKSIDSQQVVSLAQPMLIIVEVNLVSIMLRCLLKEVSWENTMPADVRPMT